MIHDPLHAIDVVRVPLLVRDRAQEAVAREDRHRFGWVIILLPRARVNARRTGLLVTETDLAVQIGGSVNHPFRRASLHPLPQLFQKTML